MRRKLKNFGYGWVTLAFFLLTVTGHWIFGWYAYAQVQREHGQPVDVSGYVVEMARDTLENWQPEFLQLLWQVGGLALLLYVGSPQSKEGDDRRAEKLDALLERVGGDDAHRLITELDRRYPRR